MTLAPDTPWYHGSPLALDMLLPGSTITPWRALAEAFSHKPPLLCIDDDWTITHTGELPGYLYRIAEPVILGTDALPHPRTTMDENLEFLTTRPLRLTLLCSLAAPNAAEIARAKAILAQYAQK